MRLRESLRGRAGPAVVVALLAAGCSSGHQSARSPSSTTSSAVAAVTSTTGAAAVTAAANPQQAAMALGQRMLGDAVLPAGARPSRAPAPNLLRGPSTVPAMGNLLYAHRLWTVSEDPRDVYRWLEAHRPRGFVKFSTNTGKSRGVPSWGVEDDLAANPPNITTAELQYGIVGDASGHAVVRVDTVVGWAQPRPANEFVSGKDRVVTVTVVHLRGVTGKRVAVTDRKLVQPIVRAFNELRVTPPHVVHGCPPMGPRTVSYRVAFAASPTASPDLIASIGSCTGVGVTVKGRPAPDLGGFVGPESVNTAFANAVAHTLGLPEPHFG